MKIPSRAWWSLGLGAAKTQPLWAPAPEERAEPLLRSEKTLAGSAPACEAPPSWSARGPPLLWLVRRSALARLGSPGELPG